MIPADIAASVLMSLLLMSDYVANRGRNLHGEEPRDLMEHE